MQDFFVALRSAFGPVFRGDLLVVLMIVLAVMSVLILWKIKPKNLKAYFGSRDGQGVARGVVLGPLVIGLIAVVALFVLTVLMYVTAPKAHAEGLKVPGTWFNDAGVFMGIDHTKKLSPMCQGGGFDDRSTSNLGAKLNVWQSPSGNVRFNTMYTHHSCALNPDSKSYDAIGVQVEWTFWRR